MFTSLFKNFLLLLLLLLFFNLNLTYLLNKLKIKALI